LIAAFVAVEDYLQGIGEDIVATEVALGRIRLVIVQDGIVQMGFKMVAHLPLGIGSHEGEELAYLAV
jgi:hypothetical protein